MSDPVTKHHTLATTGDFKMKNGGAVKGHGSHGHEHMERGEHHPRGHGGKSVHHTTGASEVSHESAHTENVGTDGGHDRSGKHGFEKGSTGSTRNRI